MGREARTSRSVARRTALFAGIRSVVTTTACVLAYYLLPIDQAFTGGTVAGLVVGLMLLALLFAWQIRMITRSAAPRLRAVEATSTTLPLFLVLFASTYYLMERGSPGSFSEALTRTDALYLALSVFSTVGFGDITANTQTARAIAMGQMIGNILFVAVAARVLVGAVQAGLRRRDTNEV
ncbi:two pore domain potassium channel family protein [Streptomyces montanus]|uniref:Two pore domain potassium channel family protein n=1 Tax=Streptomyces montanus TaxID=2580423 RepID=A0A5R9FYX0_9ACTN|nr:potassium channel family protein [Streptomyces montanus]TLS46488.1 two pore domain potassium channel family protein [Streptomyces montanus]